MIRTSGMVLGIMVRLLVRMCEATVGTRALHSNGVRID